MTAEQFVLWLDGLLIGNHGAQPSEKQWEAIVNRLTDVMRPQVSMRIKPMTDEEIAKFLGEHRPGKMVIQPQSYEDITTTLEQYGRTVKIDPKDIGITTGLPKAISSTTVYGPVVIPGVSQ